MTAAALLCTAAGLVAAGLVAIVTRGIRPAIPVLLDFLLAAGLLRLAQAPDVAALASAAAIVLLRRLVGIGLRQSARIEP